MQAKTQITPHSNLTARREMGLASGGIHPQNLPLIPLVSLSYR
jgi:hypothetical protein